MKLFYTPNPEFLSLEETNHAKNVLRLTLQSTLETTDGKGFFYNSKIVSYQKTGTILQILSQKKEIDTPKHKTHIAISPTKNADRIEWFVEKAIEIGISEITFLQCQHSERKNINLDRIDKIAIAAMKQSQKANLPVINNLIHIDDFMKFNFQNTSKYVAHLDNSNRYFLWDCINQNPTTDKLILIGPEGDFSTSEIHLALSKGFEPVTLGKARLRTETAGVYAATLFSIV